MDPTDVITPSLSRNAQTWHSALWEVFAAVPRGQVSSFADFIIAMIRHNFFTHMSLRLESMITKTKINHQDILRTQFIAGNHVMFII